MKNRFLNLGSPSFYKQRLQGRFSLGTIPKQVKPETEKAKAERAIKDILRWADNGGKIANKGGKVIENNHPILDENRRNPMNKKVGLWLNRNKAVIVSIANNVEARSIITSDMEHYILHSTVVPGDGAPEEIRDRRFWNHLGEYYDKITAQIRDATEIQIFGPEVAKFELQKHLENEGLAEHIVSVEDADALTDVQIATKVRKRFPLRSQYDIF